MIYTFLEAGSPVFMPASLTKRGVAMSGTTRVWKHDPESPSGRPRSLARQLAAASEMRLDSSGAGAGGSPFSVVLVFDSRSRRDFVRKRLIEQGVSTVAIPLPEEAEASDEDRRLSGCLLSLNCEGDGSQSDLARAAAIAEEANRQYDALSPPDRKNLQTALSDAREQPQRTIEGQHDYWPHFISAQSSPVWGHRYGRRGAPKS
jgi:hypothetical protein